MGPSPESDAPGVESNDFWTKFEILKILLAGLAVFVHLSRCPGICTRNGRKIHQPNSVNRTCTPPSAYEISPPLPLPLQPTRRRHRIAARRRFSPGGRYLLEWNRHRLGCRCKLVHRFRGGNPQSNCDPYRYGYRQFQYQQHQQYATDDQSKCQSVGATPKFPRQQH